ncbi:hypothetical protein SCG7109_AJ_00200 [Chlamydiales bacterium SCGC AG-110-M15]|nr:hypothetical protein SCG7109_AJ_00200 [Chlamydiales bacterium SCGC AG-110-M15]
MKKSWRPKQRLDGKQKNCRWCGAEFSSEYDALYCSSRCRYAYRNERISRKAKAEGLSVREFHLHEQLANIFLPVDF